jgi:probable rRNA maturation factor
MYAISICNLQHLVEIDEPQIEQVIRDVLQNEQVAAAEVSAAVVDDPHMQQLNRAHLGEDYPTDVLSFLLDCRSDPEALEDSNRSADRLGTGKRLEGEVIVSAETAAREAGRFGWSPADELLLYVVHGMLHLCGYEDSTDVERQQMRRREAEILQIRGLTPHYELTAR